MITLKDYKVLFQKEIENQDSELAHVNADNLLIKVCLDKNLSLRAKKILVEMYNKVTKWYA